MSASNELEKGATAYALDAVRLDKQGQKGRAITLYQKAIESLLQLVQLYPEYGLNKVYVQRAIAYQERIKALQGAVSSSEMNLPAPGPLLQRRAVACEAPRVRGHGDLPGEHGRYLRRHGVCQRYGGQPRVQETAGRPLPRRI